MGDVYGTYGIYGIRNKKNGMVYVGKTENNFGDRWDCHRACLNGGYGVNKSIQQDWDKYGEESFEFFIIQDCTGCATDELNDLEIKNIAMYKKNGLSYNFGIGGSIGSLLGSHLSDETKRKIGDRNRINMTGKKASDATKKKMSESHIRRYQNYTEDDWKRFRESVAMNNKGRKWTDEQKAKYSETQRTHPHSAKYSVDDIHNIRNMYEKEGMSVREISESLNMNRSTVYGIVNYTRWKNI